MTEIARFRISPFIPNAHTPLLQPMCIGVAAQKPQQLVDDALQVDLLRREKRETVLKIEAHLVSEDADGAGAGAIALLNTLVQYALQQVKILLHNLKI